MLTITIKGSIRSAEFDAVLPGLPVKLFYKGKPLRMATAVSGPDGTFSLLLAADAKFDAMNATRDLLLKVLDNLSGAALFSASFKDLYQKGSPDNFTIKISQKDFERARKKPVITFTGDDLIQKERFDIGESLHISASGLVPLRVFDISIAVDTTQIAVLSLRSDSNGAIASTIIWPQMGINDMESKDLLRHEEAARKWKGKKINLIVESSRKQIHRADISLAENKKSALVFASTKDGRPINAIEGHKEALHVSFRVNTKANRYRVMLVQRQHDWNIGDSITLATNSRNRPVVQELEAPETGSIATVRMAAAGQLLPGAYDIIIRPLHYGFENNDALQLLPRDILTARRITGLVIREDFWTAKPVLGGCVNKIPISGRNIDGAPYFRYSDTFTVGEDVWAGIDPGIVDPGNISKMCALYVIQSKDDLAWNVDNSLSHLAVLGGNAAVQKLIVQSGCMNANKRLLWPNAILPGEYDIVADFGNNSSNAASFLQDNQYNTPLDMIDGYFVPGFRVVEDPGVMTQFAHAGNCNYDENIVNGLGLNGTPSIPDENHFYFTPGDFVPVNLPVPLRANCFFPADVAGVTDPAQISAVAANYPLIVIVHGNGHQFTSYDFLLQHFAKNGFIAASIHCNGDMHGLGRANTLFKHIEVLKTRFGNKVQNNIGIMGHSRGGESVIKAARVNQQNNLGHVFNAVASLAPTDQYGSESLKSTWAKPYFVLYGSRDGDVRGHIYTAGYTVPETGFALYDRSSVPEKSMGFLYKATHNGFITFNEGGDPDLIAKEVQQAVTKAYMNAFFRMKLKNEPQWSGMFTGEWKPGSVSSTVAELFMQYQKSGAKVVDEFEGAINWESSTINGDVDQFGLPSDPVEGVLRTVDPHSPHDTQGMKIIWNNTSGSVTFSIPAAHKNVSAFTHVSIRISQVNGSNSNPANLKQNLRIALKDGSNNERAIRAGSFAIIPFPDQRPEVATRKSAMVTVRIPLTSYTIVCAGQVKVDLTNISTLTLKFSETLKGEIDIDNVEFTN